MEIDRLGKRVLFWKTEGGWIQFDFFCQGESDKPKELDLHVLDGRVNRENLQVKDVCPWVPVKVAYNNWPGMFYLYNYGKHGWHPAFFPVKYSILFGSAYPAEIILSFFDNINKNSRSGSRLINIDNIKTKHITWIDAKGDWGRLDTETGLWTGAVAKVSKTIV